MITSLGEEGTGLRASRAFVFFCFVRVSYCHFSLPPDVWGWLRFVIVALPFLFTSFNQLDNIPNFSIIRTRIRDQFLQHWCSHINNTSKLEYYSIFKTSFGFEKYLECIINVKRVLLLLGSQHIIWKLNVGDSITFQQI